MEQLPDNSLQNSVQVQSACPLSLFHRTPIDWPGRLGEGFSQKKILSPQPSYIRGWGLTSGFDCPRACTSISSGLHPEHFALGFRLKRLLSCFLKQLRASD